MGRCGMFFWGICIAAGCAGCLVDCGVVGGGWTGGTGPIGCVFCACVALVVAAQVVAEAVNQVVVPAVRVVYP